ncbi:ComEA family DNA-binding protein [Gilvimarinus sp. DA14]|uniref:ComEA family DNA-binding protein n=1 Tax=Gilvimarinus sp. DA14 TaxID=2956798 RepID=UPI0020B80D22|nr:ComEA family DNA-binding protein [Gilvimarinus sp. DA14]UTF60757.1 ComEA family DNA-binding protein [Gilvimarinus sp. DA14]
MKNYLKLIFLSLAILTFTPFTALADDAPAAVVETININIADAQTLTELKGIGEAKAEAIIAWREENGAFESPEQLLAVNGIGEATLENIMQQITLQ